MLPYAYNINQDSLNQHLPLSKPQSGLGSHQSGLLFLKGCPHFLQLYANQTLNHWQQDLFVLEAQVLLALDQSKYSPCLFITNNNYYINTSNNQRVTSGFSLSNFG